MTAQSSPKPDQSAVSELITKSNARSSIDALPLEILHNLQHQHNWTDVIIHPVLSQPTTTILDLARGIPVSYPPNSDAVILISGIPPRHGYIHPDLQNQLIKGKLSESDVQIQREWVLPLSASEKWTLKRFSEVFDSLPERDPIQLVSGTNGTTGSNIEWRDGKRILMAILSPNGMGGDGTVVYYIMQEGEVKPRQNG